MSNLTEYAKKELELAGYFDPKKDFYGGLTGKAVMELVELFAKQGHSGMSANIVRSLFNRVAGFKPLTPLTFEDDEWNESDNGKFQNRRMFSVFKEGKNGKPYCRPIVMRDPNGSTFTGRLFINENVYVGKCFIKNPANIPDVLIEVEPKTIEIDSKLQEVNMIKHPSKLEDVEKHYDVEYIRINEDEKDN